MTTAVIQSSSATTITALLASIGQTRDAKKILEQKEMIIDLDVNMRKAHMNRVASGACQASMTAPFLEVLHCIDRIGNSCINIAEVVSEKLDFQYFMIGSRRSEK